MFSLFKREKREVKPLFLALDIGTEFVKALVCGASAETGSGAATAIIRGSAKIRQKLGDMQSGAVMDIAGVIENCERAIKESSKEAGGAPQEVIMGIAGELVKGITTRITFTRPEPHIKIDMSELKNIIHKVEWRAYEEARALISYETGFNEIEIKLVNAAIVGVSIDGYRVTNPIGFQGKEVEISIFNAFAPLVHYGALQTIAAELDLNLISITAEPYAVARCMETNDKTNPSETNAIFIDIGGGTTDIAVVRAGALEGTKMFTIGGRTFSKRLAQTLSVSFEEAEEIKLAYSKGTLERQSEKIVREAMESDADVWLSGVCFTLSEFNNVDTLPGRILLCGGGSLLPEIKEALESREWSSKLPFAKHPLISILGPRQISGVKDATRSVSGPQDITPMALANIGLELIGEAHLMNTLMKKVIRLMQV